MITYILIHLHGLPTIQIPVRCYFRSHSVLEQVHKYIPRTCLPARTTIEFNQTPSDQSEWRTTLFKICDASFSGKTTSIGKTAIFWHGLSQCLLVKDG